MASIEFPKQEPTIEFPTSTGTSTPAPKPQAKGYHNQDPPGRIKNAYGRQALAGVADIVTQIPTLLGLAGTGIETAGRYIATDDDLSTSLDKSMASGFDKDLMALGKQGFDATNEVLNIPSPKTPGEVLSRLATLIVPNPSSVGRVGTALNLLTPFVKVVPKAGPTVANALRNKGNLGSLKSMLTAPGQYATKGNVARMGIQGGLGLGIDQGTRALSGMPLLLDDVSLISGAQAAEPSIEFPGQPSPVSIEFGTTSEPSIEFNEESMVHTQMEKEAEERNATLGTMGVAIGIATIAAMVWRKKVNAGKAEPSDFAPTGQGVSPEGYKEGAGAYVHGNTIDANSHLRAALRDIDDGQGGQLIPERQIDELVDAGSGDSMGKAARVGIDGVIPATGSHAQVNIPKLRDIANTLGELPQQERTAFLNGMAALREKVQRIRTTISEVAKADPNNKIAKALSERGTADQALQYLLDTKHALTKTGLYVNNFKGATGKARAVTDSEVDALIDGIEKTPHLKKLAEDYGKITEGLLDFAVTRKVITPELAKIWKREFTLNGSSVYIPGRELNAQEVGTWYERLGAAMGVGSTKQQELAGMASWQSGIAGTGTGVKNPLNAVDSLAEYTYHIVDHTDRMVAEWNILSRMTGVDDLGNFTPGRSKTATFLGIHDPSGPDAGNFTKAIINKEPGVRKKFGSVDDATFLQHQGNVMDEVIKVQRNGKEYLFWVPDSNLREVLKFKPRVLGAINKIGRNFKRVFQGTTTRLPFFTPVSFGYSTQQAWQNAVARGAKFTPVDAFRGAWRGMADGLADEVSQQWAHSLRTETGLVSHLPRQFAENMTVKMKKIVENSLLNGVQRQQGTFGSSAAVSEFNPDVLDIMKQVAPTYRDGFSGLSSAWRMYNIINKSIHEGAAAGATLKALKDITNPTAQQSRKAGRDAKSLVGDVRRMGSSDSAATFNAWVPFSGAMIQSWNSIGSALRVAMRENPTRAMAALSIPVIPAIMEAVNNSLLGEEYADYYWNKLSVEQRNNNVVLMIPGLPPEKAIMIPVSPENTLMRAMGIEMVDMMTGASRQEHMPRHERGPVGMTGENGAHVMASLVRIFDIPVPPAIQALFSGAGYSLRLGPQYHNGSVQMPFNVRKLTSGEKVSGDRGRSRYVDPAVDTEVEGVFRSLLGAVGSTLLGVTEAFRQGSSVDLETGADFAFDAAIQGVQGQTKYLGSLYKHSPFHPNSFDHIADSNRQKQSGIDGLVNQLKLLQTGGNVISLDSPVNFEGSSINKPQDPVLKIVVQSIPAIQEQVNIYKKFIAAQRTIQQELRSSTTVDNKPTTPRERQDRIDEHELTIKSLNAKLNMFLTIKEDQLTSQINQQLGLQGENEVNFSFDNYKPRPNLGEGLISKAPRKSLPPSQ